MSANTNKSVNNARKYKAEWETEHPWLMLKDNACFCKLCLCTISQFKKHNLVMHEKSEKHKKKDKDLKSCHSITKFMKQKPGNNKSLQKFDIKFSVAIACHCSVQSVDHLGEIVKEHSKGSTLEDIKLHRTKCVSLINNVVSVALFEELINELQEVKFSLFIDESTDITSTKHLCMCVRYFSKKDNILRTEFLTIIEVISTTGASLFSVIENFFKCNNIDLKNCIAFSSDGASNVCGIHNSVLSRMREVNQDIIFIKCTCHSLALCCEYASKKLPSHIDFLLAEIARWFKFSSIRQDEFKEIFALLNDGCINSKKFITPSNTRWLVKGKCMHAILTKWEELKLYFNILKEKDKNYHANIIVSMLNDETNYLYLTFMLPLIQDFEHMNAAFQATHADVCKLFKDLDVLYQSLKTKINSQCLGTKFELLLKDSKLPQNQKADVKERCLNVVKEASKQLECRLIDRTNIAANLITFKPENILCQVRPTFMDLPTSFHDFIKNNNINKIESQYEKLPYVNWKDELNLGSIPSEPTEFWAMVGNFKNAMGEKCFKEISEVMVNLFSIPFSNAFVERIFSFLTNLKSKQRNKLSISTLSSVLRIKSYLLSRKICCKHFQVTEKMLCLFTAGMYSSSSKTGKKDQPGSSQVTFNKEVADEFEEVMKQAF